MAVAPGLRVGRYEVSRKLGQGGFGILYVGRDTELDRDVALKFLRPEHVTRPDVVMRFLQEARAAAKINHPGIVTVFECGQVHGTNTRADGTVYIAMELLAGESLSQRLKRERLVPPAVAIGITRQMCAALQAAHMAGIVHRDLKPDNIFLVPDPAMRDGIRVKVLDFGVAKLADGQFGGGVRTHSSMVLGTPNYMSPEQCKSSAKVDHRSDIYAVGCILFELLCGRRPYVGDAGEQIAQHQLGPVPVPREVNESVPIELDRLVTQMLAKTPDDRPGSMEFVDEALSVFERAPTSPVMRAGSLPSAELEPPVPSTMFEGEHAPTRLSEARRSRMPLVGGAVGVIVLGVLIGVVCTKTGGSGDKTAAATPHDAAPVAVVSPSPGPVMIANPRPTPAVPAVGSGDDVKIDCLKLAADKRWVEVVSCTDRMAASDPQTSQLRAKGLMETQAERVARAATEAITAGDLARAKAELAKIPQDSVYRAETKAAYDAAAVKADAVPPTPVTASRAGCDAKALREKGEDYLQSGLDTAALVAFEQSMRCKPDPVLFRFALMAACRGKNVVKAQFYYPMVPPATTTGIVQICIRNGIQLPGPSETERPATPACDADALRQKGEDHLQTGMDAAALAAFEASMKCRPDAALMRFAFMAACRSKNAAKAKAYFPRLPPGTTTGIAAICTRNGIQLP
jgi:hypothetical protein